MQVNLLKEQLKGELKIGTIDKFQGQEVSISVENFPPVSVQKFPHDLAG
jgi:superfamily I DNA and/or RNA helicase